MGDKRLVRRFPIAGKGACTQLGVKAFKDRHYLKHLKYMGETNTSRRAGELPHRSILYWISLVETSKNPSKPNRTQILTESELSACPSCLPGRASMLGDHKLKSCVVTVTALETVACSNRWVRAPGGGALRRCCAQESPDLPGNS